MYLEDEENDEAGEEAENIYDDMANIETLNYDDSDIVSKLQKSQRYLDIMQVFMQLWIRKHDSQKMFNSVILYINLLMLTEWYVVTC